MNNRVIISFLLFLLSIVFMVGQLKAQTAIQPSGSGTSGDPYLIGTLNNLYWITQNSGQWNKVYKQTANIDASETSGWSGGAGFTPIGNSTVNFTGTYDGDGKTIDGLCINRSGTSYVGLFGYAGSGAQIKNLGVTNVYINGNWYVGGLAGRNSSGTVSNSYSKGSVSGFAESNNIGGLVGYVDGGSVEYCYSAGSVFGFVNVGGLVGEIDMGTVSNSYSAGSLNGRSCVGGLVGKNYYSTVSNSYSTGSAIGIHYVGGLVGKNYYSTVSNSYSTGGVSGSNLVGGLVGWNYGTVSNSFWDTQTSGLSTSAGGTGRTTVQMKNPSTFISAGWDFATVWAIGDNRNSGYPYLQWQYPNVLRMVILTNLGNSYTENFDTLGSDETVFPIGWSAIRFAGTGEVGAPLTLGVTDGSSDSGGVWNVGLTGESERALGTLASETTVPAFGAVFLNCTDTTITNIDFYGVMEQWRSGSSSSANEVVTFSYSFDATALNDGTWTQLEGMNFVEILTGSNSSLPVNGNDSLHRAYISGTISGINWESGTKMWIRWVDNDDSGSDGMYALENFSLHLTGGGTTSVKNSESTFPTEYSLFQNYPNPFNSSTMISYHLPAGQAGLPMNSNVTLKVFNVMGKEIATLVDGFKEAGYYTIKFNASHLASGIYYYRMQAGDFVDVKKLLLMK